MLIDIFQFVERDESRESEERLQIWKRQQELTAQYTGELVLNGQNLEDAIEAAQTLAAHEVDRPRTWYTVIPRLMYPSVLGWLSQTRGEMVELMDKGETGLLTLALTDNPQKELAAFLAQCRASLGLRIVRADPLCFSLALIPYDSTHTDMITAEQLTLRNEGLEIALRVVLELLHQSSGGTPIGVHVTKDDDWKLTQ